MSQQLRLSSLISALALISLALFARAGDIAEKSAGTPAAGAAPMSHIVTTVQ